MVFDLVNDKFVTLHISMPVCNFLLTVIPLYMKTWLIICFNVMSFQLFSQHTPHSLKEDNVLATLKSETNYFDSLIVIDKASYWRGNPKIKGFGFKGSAVYKLEISMKENEAADLVVNKFTKKKVSKPATVRQLMLNRYKFITTLNDDSLNLRPPRLNVAEPEIWSVLIMNHRNNSSVLKQSFAPRAFQKTIPTTQRSMFIEFVDAMEEQLK
jgi:hypothetical protein